MKTMVLVSPLSSSIRNSRMYRSSSCRMTVTLRMALAVIAVGLGVKASA